MTLAPAMRRANTAASRLFGAGLAAALLCAAAPPAAAEGGSFTLCYERLKQLAALYRAQGSRKVGIAEPVDAPEERLYKLRLRIGANVRVFVCTPDGRIERVAE